MPRAPPAAQVRPGQGAAQSRSCPACPSQARTRTSPRGISSPLTATAVCDPLCGSTPMITAAIAMRLLRCTRGQGKIPRRARLIPEGARWRSRLF
jgi:hypothetical protein